MEFTSFLFEPIEAAIEPPGGDNGIYIEKDDDIGPMPVERPVVDVTYGFDAQASAAALVGERRERGAIRDNMATGDQSRLDHFHQMLGSVSRHDQRLGPRAHRRLTWRQHQSSKLRAERSSTRLSGQQTADSIHQ